MTLIQKWSHLYSQNSAIREVEDPCKTPLLLSVYIPGIHYVNGTLICFILFQALHRQVHWCRFPGTCSDMLDPGAPLSHNRTEF